MKKFLVTYFAPASAVEATKNMTPEQKEKGMAAWKTWMESCGDSLVDMGAPLKPGHTLTATGVGPSSLELTGYSIIQAEDMEAAEKMLLDHPHLNWADGCSVEVHESMPMPI